jgi:hypothetical protein
MSNLTIGKPLMNHRHYRKPDNPCAPAIGIWFADVIMARRLCLHK